MIDLNDKVAVRRLVLLVGGVMTFIWLLFPPLRSVDPHYTRPLPRQFTAFPDGVATVQTADGSIVLAEIDTGAFLQQLCQWLLLVAGVYAALPAFLGPVQTVKKAS